ncbi:hypothetical protein ACHHYP_12235 [Achlya hypogyna]|uniref:ABC transporter domain-containing protein n=1 Tax=Achlya hypogyna TaxID=1202772 RepID=A0A1V9YHD2_ACHHY|nr:hypothetical protein ACHHYP_12235 [Achlya hypogyna]
MATDGVDWRMSTELSSSDRSRPDTTIYSEYSLMIPVGQTLALVGASGRCKSSGMGLIDRFYV